jgi:uncharacterized protein YjbI with pentapeptide repeats
VPDDLEATTVDVAAIESGSEWARVALAEDELSELAVPGLRFEESRLQRVDLSASRLARLSLSDVELDGCNLANADVRGGTLWRGVVERARLTGLFWNEGALRDVVVRDCRIDLASFAKTRFEQVVFERCLLMQTELQEASLRLVRFVDCDLTEVDLTQATFDRCEMRGCTLDGVRAPERLRGVSMPVDRHPRPGRNPRPRAWDRGPRRGLAPRGAR